MIFTSTAPVLVFPRAQRLKRLTVFNEGPGYIFYLIGGHPVDIYNSSAAFSGVLLPGGSAVVTEPVGDISMVFTQANSEVDPCFRTSR